MFVSIDMISCRRITLLLSYNIPVRKLNAYLIFNSSFVHETWVFFFFFLAQMLLTSQLQFKGIVIEDLSVH